MSPYDEDRLPGHDRRRRELLAMLGTEPPARHRILLPGIAAGAVLAVCAVGVLAAQPWRGPENLSAAGPVAGQDPSQGVPRESARAGDPVPWDVAARTLAACLGNGRRAAVQPPPTGFGTQPPGMPLVAGGGAERDRPPAPDSSPPGTASGWSGEPVPPTASSGWSPPATATSPTPLSWPTERATHAPGAATDSAPARGGRPPSRVGPDASPGKVHEPDAAFEPYFTAWEPDGSGGLRPFVLGKATKPGLLVCHGAEAVPTLPAPTAPDGTLAGAFELRSGPIFGTPQTALGIDPRTATTWWGRATASVARIVVELPDGTTVGAVVRNGIWFASLPDTPTAAPRVRAYDAAGTLLADVTTDREHLRCATSPLTKGCGTRTHWG